jgi:hypothetical protein
MQPLAPLTPLIRRANQFNQAPMQGVQPLAANEEQSLLSTIGHTGLSAISKAGNLLDLPGSMVRDMFTWMPGGMAPQNPFDQLLSPFSHENRATGRDVLEQFGMRENKETGFVPLQDPGEFARDFAGFAAEVALDPLAWWAGWASKSAGAASSYAAKRQTFGRPRAVLGKVGTAWEAIDPGYKIGRMLAGRYRTFRQPQRTRLLEDKVRPFIDTILKGSKTGELEGITMNTDEVLDAFDAVNEATAKTWSRNNPGKKVDDWYGEKYKDFVNMEYADFVKAGLNKRRGTYSQGARMGGADDLSPAEKADQFESLIYDSFPNGAFENPKFMSRLDKFKSKLASGSHTEDQLQKELDKLVGVASDAEFRVQEEMFESVADIDAWRNVIYSRSKDFADLDEDQFASMISTREGMDKIAAGKIEDYASQLERFLKNIEKISGMFFCV